MKKLSKNRKILESMNNFIRINSKMNSIVAHLNPSHIQKTLIRQTQAATVPTLTVQIVPTPTVRIVPNNPNP